jgi:hypothetical protein
VRTYVSVALAVLAVNPAFASIIDVSMNGSVFGSGAVTFFCFSDDNPNCPQGTTVSTPPFNFSGTNTQLGMFTASGSASGIDPNSGELTTASGQANQTATASGDSFSLDLFVSVSSSGTGAQEAFSSDIFDQATLTFTLTTQSLMQLSDTQNNTADVLPYAGSLSGPTGDILDLPEDSASFDVALTLEPGTYEWSELIEGPSFPTLFVNDTEVQEVAVSATFAAIPEPRGAWMAPLLLLILGSCLIHRGRRFARHRLG